MADVTTALTEEQIKDILNKINAATTTTTTTNTAAPAGAPNPTFNPLTTDFTRPVLQDGTALANKYGITAGYDDIKKIYGDAVDASYDAQRKVYDQGTAAYYETIRNNAATLLDTLRKANASALATGSTRGVAAAQQLSALLAAAQSGSQGALDLANKIFNLGDTYKADRLAADRDALTTSNTAGATLGQLSTDQYAAMTQAWAAELAAQQNGGGYSSSYSSGYSGGGDGGGSYSSNYSSNYGGSGIGTEGTDYAFQSDTDLWNEYAKQLTANGLDPNNYYLDANGELQLKADGAGGAATPAGHRLQQEELVQKITSDGVPTKTPSKVTDVAKELLQATDGSGFNGGKYSTAIMNNLTPYEQADPSDAENVGKLLDTVARNGQSNAGSIGALFDQIPADQRQALYEQFYDRAKLADQRYSWVPTNTKTGEGYWVAEKQDKLDPRLINSAADWLGSQTNRDKYTIKQPDFKLFPNDVKISTSVDSDFQKLSDKDFLNRTAVPMLNELYATGKPLKFNWDTPGEDVADQHRKDTAKARYNELVKKYGYDKIIKAYEDAGKQQQWRQSQQAVKNTWDKTYSGQTVNGLLNVVKSGVNSASLIGGKIKTGLTNLANDAANRVKLANAGNELKRYEPNTVVDAYTAQRRNAETNAKDAAARVAVQKSLIPKYTPGMDSATMAAKTAAEAAAKAAAQQRTPSYVPGMPTSVANAQSSTPGYIPGMPTAALAAQQAARAAAEAAAQRNSYTPSSSSSSSSSSSTPSYTPGMPTSAVAAQQAAQQAAKNAAAKAAASKPSYIPGMPTSAVAAQQAAQKKSTPTKSSYTPGMPTSAVAAQQKASSSKPSYTPGMPTSAVAAQAAAQKKKK